MSYEVKKTGDSEFTVSIKVGSAREVEAILSGSVERPASGTYCVKCSFFATAQTFQFNSSVDLNLGAKATAVCLPLNGSGFYEYITPGSC